MAEATGPNVLTQAEAEARAAAIGDVSYALDLSLSAGAETYDAEAVVRFAHAAPADGAFLDFTGREVHSVEVNGAERTVRRERNRLYLDGADLAANNEVRVRYRNDYDHIGAGLHQFVDPEDGAEYLYTHFEPYDAHRLLPCFDQPDLKAAYDLTVTAPSEWEVVGNYPAAEMESVEGGARTRRRFETTPRFSTYLLALAAGPYVRFDDRWEDTPLGVLCRSSLEQYFDADEFFEVTRQGLSFYSDFFDFRYPFGKYDQVFVPEFNMGAMENVGCITYSERMIFRDPPTEIQRLNRAEVVLHEMAHMWFGDLVTMQWWNDLWLNESFATYMAYLAMQRATRFGDSAWSAFHARMKAWAYEQDQLPTTHPIAGEVPDTDATFLNFDGITYGKGAAVLKQLVAFLGDDGFREGMRDYFRTHAWGNTTLADFLSALERGSGRELGRWSQLWLERAGVNTIAANFSVADGAVNSFTMQQSAPADHPDLRPHRTEIAVYDAGDDGPVLRDAVPVDLDGAETVIEGLVGIDAPAAVFPNHADHAFAKIALDFRSLAFVREQIDRFPTPFERLLFWHTLWDMVRDQQFAAGQFVALAADKLAGEDTLEIAQTVAGRALYAVGRYIPEQYRLQHAAQLFDLAWNGLYATGEQDFRIVWARILIGAAQEPERIRRVLALADDGSGIEGFELDQDMRWSLVAKAVAYSLEGGFERLAPELERDSSDRGQRAAETVRASRAEAAVKSAAWSRFQEDRDASLHILSAAMHGFWWRPQDDLLAPYVGRFFDEVRGVFAERDKEYATRWFGALYPGHLPSEEVVERSDALLSELGSDDQVLARSLRESLDEVRRARACQNLPAAQNG